MAMQWWGTVNLPAVVAARCNDPCHHRASTSRFAVDGAVAHMAHREERGGGVRGNWCMHEDEIRYDDCMCNEKRDCLCRLSI